MIEYRHLVTSLVAVFIALGLGILIGSFLGKAGDRPEPSALVQLGGSGSEEDQIKELLTANVNLIGTVQIYEEFGRILRDSLSKDVLYDRKIALVVTGHQPVPSGMLEALNLAGAQVVSQTIVGDLELQAEGLQNGLIHFYGLSPDASKEEIRRQVGISTGVIIGGQDSPSTVDYLSQWNLVHFAGDYLTPIDGIVILGGAVNDTINFSASFDVGLVLGLGQHPGVKVGVECSDAAVSYMSEYQQLRLRTIDNVDQLPGEYSLIMALNQAEGSFGIKSTARQLVPAF